MTDEHGWQSLVEQYLEACYQDLKHSYRQKLNNATAMVIEQFASSMIVDMYREQIESSLASLTSYPPANSWNIEEETDRRVLVEIAKSKSFSIPLLTTRLLLVKPRDAWQLHDILQPCLRCGIGSRAVPGKCRLCRGTGKLLEELPCRSCQGTGLCSACSAETAVGWCRATFLERR